MKSYEQISLKIDFVLDEQMQQDLDVIEAYYNSLEPTKDWSRERILETVIRGGFAFRLADAAGAYKDLIDK